jgi:hypothetical protein
MRVLSKGHATSEAREELEHCTVSGILCAERRAVSKHNYWAETPSGNRCGFIQEK